MNDTGVGAASGNLVPSAGDVITIRAGGAKSAVTVVFWVSATTHGPVPLHPPPLQPAKVWPAAGAAVSVARRSA